MKDLTMLIWFTQLGISVAVPPALAVLIAVWLRDTYGWGDWVIWVGIGFGVVCAVDGFLSSLKTMNRLSKKDRDQSPPPPVFNDHT